MAGSSLKVPACVKKQQKPKTARLLNCFRYHLQNRCQQYQNTIQRLNQEIFSLRKQLEQSALDSNQGEGLLQAQREALHRHAEESRKQYERCLDDVANQVVRALLAQKVRIIWAHE